MSLTERRADVPPFFYLVVTLAEFPLILIRNAAIVAYAGLNSIRIALRPSAVSAPSPVVPAPPNGSSTGAAERASGFDARLISAGGKAAKWASQTAAMQRSRPLAYVATAHRARDPPIHPAPLLGHRYLPGRLFAPFGACLVRLVGSGVRLPVVAANGSAIASAS